MKNDEFTRMFDPFGIASSGAEVWRAMIADPEQLIRSQQKLADAWAELLQSGPSRPTAPEKNDKRFAHPAWAENPSFNLLKRAYLTASDAIISSIEATRGADRKTLRRAKFFVQQLIDAMSPTNMACFNPAVIEETMRTGGQNLANGMKNLLEDLTQNNGRVPLVDKNAFDVGRNVAMSAGKVVHRNDLAELIQYAPATATVHTRPVLVVSPWINKYYVLDLQPTNSFIKNLVERGYTAFVISWRNPDAAMADTSMEDYLTKGPLECSRVATNICKTPDLNVVGYCIGGTLVAMLLAYLAARQERLVHSATLLASLIDFEDAGEIDAFLGEDALAALEKKMSERGYLQGSEMGDTFNMLRSNDLIWSVAVNRYLLGKDAPAFDLLYWNSDSTRMPRAMHSYYLRNMYVENNLVKPNTLRVLDTPIDLRRVKNDVYCVATLEDHIAPWRSVYQTVHLFSGQVQFRLGHSGHIAGIVNPPSREKGHWWSAPTKTGGADEWLSRAQQHEGSWWADWNDWLAVRSGPQVKARKPGNKKYPAGEDAPGSYVREK
ncbi:MAG: class I poly(R)-hydroxyalkanoic acid synthase [Candidatus Eremiobacteraeota bacterium]|nr:class I poly(R)-hydroxyalkanoic acid synthase [Candidatus Eremiobacteraeota bacterium]